jgi:hypothetical protein
MEAPLPLMKGGSMTEKEILAKLDAIELRQTGCEDIMTFNGTPIGMTVSKNIEIDRWWTDLKASLAHYLNETRQ